MVTFITSAEAILNTEEVYHTLLRAMVLTHAKKGRVNDSCLLYPFKLKNSAYGIKWIVVIDFG